MCVFNLCVQIQVITKDVFTSLSAAMDNVKSINLTSFTMCAEMEQKKALQNFDSIRTAVIKCVPKTQKTTTPRTTTTITFTSTSTTQNPDYTDSTSSVTASTR